MNDITHTIQIIDALDKFQRLKSAIDFLLSSIEDSHDKIIIPSKFDNSLFTVNPKNNLDYVSMCLSDLWYRADEKGITTRKYKGVVLCSSETLFLASELNKAKDNFAKSVRIIRDSSNQQLNHLKYAIGQHSAERDELTSMGMGRINLNHCYRHIHIFNNQPDKIHYSNSSHENSITRITPKEAREALLKLSNPEDAYHIEAQILKLNTLRTNEDLAVVRQIAPHFKVNAFNSDAEKLNISNPITRKPGLPIFSLYEGKKIDIRFEQKNKRKDNVKTRSDKIISDEIFIKSLNAHRYI